MRPENFRELGLLQEVNRLVLHPCGIALTLEADGDSLRVKDCRSQPERARFAFRDLAAAIAKADSVEALADELRRERERAFGASVQPIPGRLNAERVSLAADDETVDLCLGLAVEAVEWAGLSRDDGDRLVEAILLKTIGPLVASLRLHEGRLLASAGEDKADCVNGASRGLYAPAIAAPTPKQLARARWLAKELPRIAAEHSISGGTGTVPRLAPTELYPAEADEARALSARVSSWPLVGEMPSDAAEVIARMEDLFALGQSGMRFWRGQRPDLVAAADVIHARLDAYRATRSELDRFLCGELAAHELSDPDEVRRVLTDRASPLREALTAADSERAAIQTALAPIASALSRLEREGA